jgi:hypothetical protein
MVQAFKSVATRALRRHLLIAGLPARRKEEDHNASKKVRNPVWSRGYWMRYLDDDRAIATATAYVKRQA